MIIQQNGKCKNEKPKLEEEGVLSVFCLLVQEPVVPQGIWLCSSTVFLKRRKEKQGRRISHCIAYRHQRSIIDNMMRARGSTVGSGSSERCSAVLVIIPLFYRHIDDTIYGLCSNDLYFGSIGRAGHVRYYLVGKACQGVRDTVN